MSEESGERVEVINRMAVLLNAASVVRRLNNERHNGASAWLIYVEENLRALASDVEEYEPPSEIEQQPEITLDSPTPPEELPSEEE